MPKKKTTKKKYTPDSKEKYMCAKHKKFFTEELVKWKKAEPMLSEGWSVVEESIPENVR